MIIENAAMLPEDALTGGVMLRRLFAWIVDVFLIGLLCGAAFSFFVAVGVLTFGLSAGLFGTLPFIPLLYHWITLASPMSGSPGQALFGLEVRRNDDLGRPTVLQALVFTVLLYVTLAAGALWVLVAIVTVRHRTFHDMLSGLVVIRSRALTGLR